MSSNKERKDIEQTIVRKLRQVNINIPDQVWIRSPEYDQFLNSWRELYQYYERTHDNVVSTNMIHAYVEQCRILRGIFENERAELINREAARVALASLEGWMDKILEVSSTYYLEENYDEDN